MARSGYFRGLILWSVIGGLAGVVRAEDAAVASPEPSAATAPAVPATPAANPIVTAPGSSTATTSVRPETPRRRRAISPEVAAQLSAASPKFTPAPPKPAPKPEEEEEDLRETDKPRNGIIRLPKYVVREPAPAVLNERAVNTKKGLADIAMKRYMTEGYKALNAFSLPLFGTSQTAMAMAMYEEDERLKNMSDLNESARMVSSTDKASGLYVKRQVDQAFMRQGDFDWRPIGR